MPDFGTIGDNLAARYLGLATPANADAIRSSSADIPRGMPATPCVLVFVDASSLDLGGNGSRAYAIDWFVRLYYDQSDAGDLERDVNELRDWLTVLVDVLKTGLQLTGAVVAARTSSARVGLLTFAGKTYSGVELKVRTIGSEPWPATA